jgi:hypothetical protein
LPAESAGSWDPAQQKIVSDGSTRLMAGKN